MDKKLSNCYISDTYAKTFWCRGDQKLSKFFVFSQKFVAVYKKYNMYKQNTDAKQMTITWFNRQKYGH